MTAYIKINN